MPEHLISFDDAARDPLACAAYIAEAIAGNDGRAAAMETIVPIYLSRGDVDMAAELANTVADPFVRDQLLIRVAEKCSEIDDVEYAMQLVDAVEDGGLRLQALETVGLRRAASGDFFVAREIAAGLEHPEFVLASMAARQASSGDTVGSDSTLNEIDFPAARVAAYEEIAASAYKKGEADAAVETANKGVAASGEIPHDEERTRALCGLGDLFIEMQRNDRAVEVFEAACANAENIDNVHRDPLLALAASGFARAGSVELADRALDMVSDKTSIATGLLAFARVHARKGENVESAEALEEAYAILRSQKEKETRDTKAKNNLHAQIAGQFAGVGKGERAIEVAGELADENAQVSALSQITRVLVQRGDTELAHAAIRAIGEEASRVNALIAMSDAYFNKSDETNALATVTDAANLVETIPQPASRSTAYNEITVLLAKYSEPEKPLAFVRSNLETILLIRDESSRAAAMAALADAVTTSNITLGETELQMLHQAATAADR